MLYHRGYNSARIKPISSYAQAKERYDKVVPIRGRDNVRPLGDKRRYCWVNIVKKTVSIESADHPLGQFAEVYSCAIYGRDIIDFYPSGDIVFHGESYRGVSVMNMVTYALSGLAQIGSMRGKWYFVNKKGQNFVINDDKPTTFSLVDGDYQPSLNDKEYVYRLNRKEMNGLRKQYKKFLDYACTALGMDDNLGEGDSDRLKKIREYLKLKGTELIPTFNWNHKPDFKRNRAIVIKALDDFNESGDLELAYNLMQLFAVSAGRYSYRTSQTHCSPRELKHYFDEFLKHHFRDKLFVKEEVEVGKAFHDSNKKYVLSEKYEQDKVSL
jgi:hypothetical protein